VRCCMWCRAYITIAMHTSEMLYVVSSIYYDCHAHQRIVSWVLQLLQTENTYDTCRELGSNIISYKTRATQVYPQNQGSYNPYEINIEAKKRPGQNLPADSHYTMVMPQRIKHPNAVRLAHTAPLTDLLKAWPKTHEKWSRLVAQTTSLTTASRVIGAPLATSTSSTTNV
jgi:hypothetical protein